MVVLPYYPGGDPYHIMERMFDGGRPSRRICANCWWSGFWVQKGWNHNASVGL